MTHVLDSSAVICWVSDEPGRFRVEELLLEEAMLMHAVNLVEVLYQVERRQANSIEGILDRLTGVGIEIVPGIDDEMIQIAVNLKAHHTPIALGDVFAVSLAVSREATLLTTNRGELGKNATAGICQIEFLR